MLQKFEDFVKEHQLKFGTNYTSDGIELRIIGCNGVVGMGKHLIDAKQDLAEKLKGCVINPREDVYVCFDY